MYIINILIELIILCFNLGSILVSDPDFIYELLLQVQLEFKQLIPFGALNSAQMDELYNSISNKDIESLNFPSSLSLLDRARLIARCELSYRSEPPHTEIFIKGIGVCTHLNFFAMMVLAKEYNFVARLETIYSDETHTYLVLTADDGKEYVLDLWSNTAFDYSNTMEWNEAMPFKYARRKGHEIKVDSYWDAVDLRALWTQLEKREVLEAKRRYYDSVMDRAIKSKGPLFFASSTTLTESSVSIKETRYLSK